MKSKFESNYLVIQGWMITELNLKGRELMAFALVYGFTQDGHNSFTGSLSYIGKWLNCSRPTVITTMEKLTSSGWLLRKDAKANGIDRNTYRVNMQQVESARGSKEILPEVVKKLYQGSKETLPNNYNNKDKDNIGIVVFDENDPAYLVTTVALERIEENVTDPALAAPRPAKKKAIAPHVDEVIAYLNTKAETAFRPSTKSTISAINARLDEGYTVADFKAVIDCKAAQWKGDAEMQRYLRPETLFRPAHFESYLNEARRAPAANTDAALKDLPGLDEDSAQQYGRFIVHVQEHYPALWRSACRVFSQSEYFDYMQNKTIPGVALNLTAEEKRAHLARVMKELSASEGKRKQYGTVWQAYEVTMRALLNGKKVEI